MAAGPFEHCCRCETIADRLSYNIQMEPKRSKYDTNPLEEDFADRATDAFGSERSDSQTARVFGGPTLEINRSNSDSVRAYSESEAPTRQIGDNITSYPSIFVPPPKPAAKYQAPRVSAADIYQPPPGPPPAIYSSPGLRAFEKSGMNNVSGLGMQERWAVMLPYLPFSWLAIVASIILLILVPRTESKVRFHAAQGLVLQLGITAISMLLTFVGFITRTRMTGASLFGVVTSVFLVLAMIRVFKGKPLVLAPLDDPRKWLDEKIKPRK
jgi:uncharacterized membrane protein